ncbi:hypothetical protein [Wenyingzhuangia marina]|uniref:Uncharacterized protein n=1 Tax=Wenyingzhuangia marina TaxID=1195760 RepID=A0A1M5UKU3_9FLAO|nr:hypothetical protein [Wenyingzhuangia marina]GGF67067.1 hypothetical protein GCM10011397_07690 [Wenyingzhuangia marina]SHH63682.1 hypothetical protein SAMN05444281_1331 [Wenyingzhuangia marina]
MLKKFRNNIFIKILFGILGIHLFNISIDIPLLYPINHSKELSFNNQDSIVELLLEKVLGFENAIEEQESTENDDCKQKNNLNIELIAARGAFFKTKLLRLKETKHKFHQLIPQFTDGHIQLDTPPPKA